MDLAYIRRPEPENNKFRIECNVSEYDAIMKGLENSEHKGITQNNIKAMYKFKEDHYQNQK